MNFNIVSPTDNGHEFTTMFKEHITIAPNSCIKVNYVELIRDKEVIIPEDASIILSVSASDMVPLVKPSDQTDNLPFDTQTSLSKTLTINAGNYSFIEFRDAIEVALVTGLAASNFKSYEVFVENNENEAELLIAIMPETTDTLALVPFQFSATHAHDAANLDAAGQAVSYTSPNATSTYDNYALAASHYYHYIDNASLGEKDTAQGNLDTTSQNNAYIHVTSTESINQQGGNADLWLGLYSPEYADGIAPAPATRINGNNPPPLDASGHPKTHVGFQFKEDGELQVWYAVTAAGDTITDWLNINQEIDTMKLVARIPASNFDPTSPWDVVIGTQIDNSKNEPSMRILVGAMDGDDFTALWDSGGFRNLNLPYKLMVGNGITYDNATAVNSQIPWAWLTSVSQNAANTYGFEELNYKEFNKALGSNANPVSLTKKITINFTESIARALAVSDSIAIRPNQYALANSTAVVSDLDFNYKKNNYSVMVDLPINNFKNKSGSRNTRQNAAVKKQVLVNIPAAFATGDILAESDNLIVGNAEVVTVYQPYQEVINYLDNNAIQLNSMNFQIVDMLSEERATEIKRSVINFSIIEKP